VAREKGAFAWNVLHLRRMPLRPVLSADTTVTVDGEILGKPANPDEAAVMLERLSGRTHQVLTSVALHHTGIAEHVTQVSNVRFAKLSPATIKAYCATPEPYDKAGAYGVQGLAALFIEHIEGSHSGIMGLPVFETAQLLRARRASSSFEPKGQHRSCVTRGRRSCRGYFGRNGRAAPPYCMMAP
jgi:septum formation protein